MSDIRDLALEHLAADELAVVDLAAELKAERDAYRMLAQVALAHCHEQTERCRRQSETIARLTAITREFILDPRRRGIA